MYVRLISERKITFEYAYIYTEVSSPLHLIGMYMYMVVKENGNVKSPQHILYTMYYNAHITGTYSHVNSCC